MMCEERSGARLFFVYVQDSDRERCFLTLSTDLGISFRLGRSSVYLHCLFCANTKIDGFDSLRGHFPKGEELSVGINA